jgi:hypothetical protein
LDKERERNLHNEHKEIELIPAFNIITYALNKAFNNDKDLDVKRIHHCNMMETRGVKLSRNVSKTKGLLSEIYISIIR